MFCPNITDIETVLHDYHIKAKVKSFSEIQRYHYEQDDPDSKEVRLIVKVDFEEASPLVVRFKNESDVTLELMESQCLFAKALLDNGIQTPKQYQTDGKFAKWYLIGGYDVIVTVEQFVENEIKVVDALTAEKTGVLLAKMHNISQEYDLHVNNDVLFDPFADNDLFEFEVFRSLEASLDAEDKALFDRISAKYQDYLEVLSPLRASPRYAVQGDISDCNLYLADSGEIGVFDFNRSGDNILYCDAVMQAVFEARLMDYPEDRGADFEAVILEAFLRGYRSVRSFSEEEQKMYPYLYAIITAFWRFDMRWGDDSLLNAHKNGDSQRVHEWLLTIWDRLASVD